MGEYPTIMGEQKRRFTRRRLLGSLAAGLGVVGTAPMLTHGEEISSPLIAGHRGAAGLAPPNTILAIERALAAGDDGVELDVRRTADGELVLFHDPILDVASDASGFVSRTTMNELENARVHGEPIPTLAEALSLLAGTDVEVLLELKEGGYAEAVLDAVRAFGLLDRTTIISLAADHLRPVAAARDGVDLGVVASVPTPELIEDAVAVDAKYVFAHYTPQGIGWLVEEATRHGLDAGVWSLVDGEVNTRDVLSYDIDVLTTNRPDLAVQYTA